MQWLVFQVSGVSILGLSVLKNAVMFAGYACVFWTARPLLGALAAAAISASLVLVTPIGWDALLDRTHSPLLTALTAGALGTYFTLLSRPGRLRSALFGLLLGLGMLSKYNFALFAFALAGASLCVPAHRRLVWTRDLWITVAVATLCVLPHAAWFIGQVDAATRITFAKMNGLHPEAGYGAQVASGAGQLAYSFAAFVSPLWIAFVAAYRSPRQGTLRLQTPQAQFFLWFYVIGLAFIVALILSGHLAFIKPRWLQATLFTLPLAVCVVFPPKLAVVYRRLLRISAVSALLIMVALVLRPIIQSALDRHPRTGDPYAELAAELVRRFPDATAIAVQDPHVGGNVRMQLPRMPVLLFDNVCKGDASGGRVLLLIPAGSEPDIGRTLNGCPGALMLERGRIDVRSSSGHPERLVFGYALLKRVPK
jgi:4-amino-4-deoxy-L-arabinose transferase-like glycosyltransferase